MSNELSLFFVLFARLFGFFLISPLFPKGGIPVWVRFSLTLSCSLVLLPPLSTQLTLVIENPALYGLELLKETAIGYLLGFLFSLLFESVAFAGQVLGTLTGFSATELLDPLANAKIPLLSQLFVLTLFALFLALDLHHALLRLLFDSYLTIPSSMPYGIIEATTRLFHHALAYAFFPLSLLLIVILCFAIIARFFPSLQIFWTGFPLQLLIGIGGIAFAISFFGHILQGAFYELWSIAKKILFSL